MSLWLADLQLAGYAPAFTLSLDDSECSRKPPMPIVWVVIRQCKKKEKGSKFVKRYN